MSETTPEAPPPQPSPQGEGGAETNAGATREIALPDGAKVDVTFVAPVGQPPVVQPAGPAAPLTAAEALDQWVDRYVRNSPYAHDQACWAAVVAAVSGLKARLARADAQHIHPG